MKCDRCRCEARWEVYAAYPVDSKDVYRRAAHYPMPMAQVCIVHLPGVLLNEIDNPGSTGGWYVRAAPAWWVSVRAAVPGIN